LHAAPSSPEEETTVIPLKPNLHTYMRKRREEKKRRRGGGDEKVKETSMESLCAAGEVVSVSSTP